jgi:hypothetical protein
MRTGSGSAARPHADAGSGDIPPSEALTKTWFGRTGATSGRISPRSSPSAAQPRPASVLSCGTMISVLKAALRLGGFAWTTKWIRRRVQCVPTTSANAAVVTATASAVAMAGALYPGRALCLEQSLVLYYLLRRQGFPVRYCHGVRPHPFQAHAWVEHGNEPINDVSEHVALFMRFPDLLP